MLSKELKQSLSLYAQFNDNKCYHYLVDQHLRKLLREAQSDPSIYPVVARSLVRSGASAVVCGDFLEAVIRQKLEIPDGGHRSPSECLYIRDWNIFQIGWMHKKKLRKCLFIELRDGGEFGPGIDQTVEASRANYVTLPEDRYNFVSVIDYIALRDRLPLPTPKLLELFTTAIRAHNVEDVNVVRPITMGVHQEEHLRIDITLKVDPKKDWKPSYHLAFHITRTVATDILEASIEDNLFWGTADEVQGLRISGTHWTHYGGEEPEGPDDEYVAGVEHSTYERIHDAEAIKNIVETLIHRFREEVF